MWLKLKISLLLVICFTIANVASTQTLFNKTGDFEYYFDVKTTRIAKDKIVKTIKAPHKSEKFTLSFDSSTLKWELKNRRASSDIIVERKQNKLILSGQIGSTLFKRKVEYIDNYPWFQSLEAGAGEFLRSKKTSQIFWSLNSETLSLHQMEFNDKERVVISVDGKELEAVKIRMTFPGWRSMFWSTYFWYSFSDNKFIRYEGRNGPPGTKNTTITIVNKKHNN
ncbi:hypothetical protein DID80_02940 [Candidatus Marinamargulisbacteria bacterium SCGC AAA071-K20]|nr:hypothetical protein DID80_02940 [Candidatus Marinamargulisbacteria bacterium SCGC AAA071-K20]